MWPPQIFLESKAPKRETQLRAISTDITAAWEERRCNYSLHYISWLKWRDEEAISGRRVGGIVDFSSHGYGKSVRPLPEWGGNFVKWSPELGLLRCGSSELCCGFVDSGWLVNYFESGHQAEDKGFELNGEKGLASGQIIWAPGFRFSLYFSPAKGCLKGRVTSFWWLRAWLVWKFCTALCTKRAFVFSGKKKKRIRLIDGDNWRMGALPPLFSSGVVWFTFIIQQLFSEWLLWAKHCTGWHRQGSFLFGITAKQARS